MTRLLGKAQFEKTLGKLVQKPLGKPTLVRESDDRPEMRSSTESAQADFADTANETDTAEEPTEAKKKSRNTAKKTKKTANTESEE